MSQRIYALYNGAGPTKILIRWGKSRFGNKPDNEIDKLVCKDHVFGKQSLYVEWIPEPIKQHSAERMRAQRINNAKKRIEKKAPLFVQELMDEELKRDKFSIEQCKADHEHRHQIDLKQQKEWFERHPASLEVSLEQ